MRNFKRYLSFVAVFAMLFTSCSKEESGVNVDSEKATLTFGAIVNDLVTNRSADKQSEGDIPDCSNDTPTYIEIVLMQGDEYILGTTEDPYQVDLAAGEVFTVEDENLELVAGNYSLVHFSVYNNDDELIWIAPRAGSDLAGYMDRTLPMAIDLNAGVKKYVDVPVLCFDNREINQYGYLFFEVNTNTAIQYCFFANYCADDGRHYSAAYTVSIWAGNDSTGTPLYLDVANNTGQYSNGDYFATPLCFALPDNEGDLNEDYLYYEVTLSDWDGVYGDVDPMVMSGTLSKQDIMDTWEGDDDSNYNHLRFGCAADDDNGNGGGAVDSDGDGIPDTEDECPNEAGPASNNGCPETTPVDSDGDGIPDTEDECPDEAGPASNNGCPETTPVDSDGDGIPDTEDECPNEAGPASNNGCPETTPVDSDGDGIPDTEDACPNEAGPASNNGCPVDTDDCIDESGNVVTFEETVDISGFPVGIDPFYPLFLNGEEVGTITFDLTVGDNLVVRVDMFDGSEENQFRDYTVTTAELTLSNIDDDPLCVSNINANEFAITWDRENDTDLNYPLEVSFRANVIITTE